MIKRLAALRRKPAAGAEATAAPAPAGGAAAAGGERVSALLEDMRRRLGRPAAASRAAADGPVPALPRRRSVEQWLGLAGALAAAAVVVWLMTAGWGLVAAGRAAAQLRLDPPTLAQFPPLHRARLLPAQRLSPDLARALAPNEDRLARAWQNVAAFENARSEPLLRGTRSVLQGVVPGSAAEAAGLEAGDVVVQVDGKAAGFAWDVYKAITERPLQQVELTLTRGAETLQATLRRPAGEVFDMTLHGLLFPVPGHLRFLGRTDVDRLAAQVRAGYVDSLPAEWRAHYVEGLLAVSNELVGNLSALVDRAPDAADYLRTEELVTWYHRSFVEALGRYRIELERTRERQSAALQQLGAGLLVAGLAILAAGGARLRRAWQA